jgi:GlpG protein
MSANYPPQRRRSLEYFGVGPLTCVLIAISVIVALLSRLGEKDDVLDRLFITADGGPGGRSLPEIREGQVWRLITPIFIHFGWLHILFNMAWLRDLGSAIEKLVGSGALSGLVLTTAIISNLGQFYFAGAFFGGMSGVVYGLFGYVWMKSVFDRGSGFNLRHDTVYWMIGWFVVCMLGWVGPVANFGHGFGLATGVVWGFLSARIDKGRNVTLRA